MASLPMDNTPQLEEGHPLTCCSSPERRKDRRHPWRYRGTTKVLLRSTQHVLEAQSLNLSLRGIGLILREPPEIGTLVAIFPPRPQAATACALTARVIRTQARKGGRWYVGCALLRPLSQTEVQEFLA
jgi:hypothetical protein